MNLYADYEINISKLKKFPTDTANGEATHEISRHFLFFPRVRFKGIFRILRRPYDRERARLGYKNLDFFVHKREFTRLVFKINNPDWVFQQKDPIVFKVGPRPEISITRDGDDVQVDFMDASTLSIRDYKYTLNYTYRGIKIKHDPIINNGSVQPFTGLYAKFLAILFISATIIVTTSVAVLMKIGII